MYCLPDADTDGIVVANCVEGDIVAGVAVSSNADEVGGTVDVVCAVGCIVETIGCMVAAGGSVEGIKVVPGLGVGGMLSGDRSSQLGWH